MKQKYRVWEGGIRRMSKVVGLEFKDEIIIHVEDGGITSPHKDDTDYLESVVLMQYTGLEDKNRKEIYGDDIVKTIDGICIVKYGRLKPATFTIGFYLEHPKYSIWSGIGEIEVIGNIYENKDLIK